MIKPISTTYHGYDVFELPPPGQGFAALQMLNILDVCVPRLGANLAKLGPSEPMYWHLMVEAKKLAYRICTRSRTATRSLPQCRSTSSYRNRTRRRSAIESI